MSRQARSVKTYLRTSGDTINHVFPIPYDFTGYSCGVMQITGAIALKSIPVSPSEAEPEGSQHSEGEEEVSFSTKKRKEIPKGSLFLCCDICEDSPVAGTDGEPCRKMPVLRELPNPRKANTRNVDTGETVWLDVTTPFIKDIRLYILNENGEEPSFRQCDLHCTLVFWKPK
jgi:hypothetical protein